MLRIEGLLSQVDTSSAVLEPGDTRMYRSAVVWYSAIVTDGLCRDRSWAGSEIYDDRGRTIKSGAQSQQNYLQLNY